MTDAPTTSDGSHRADQLWHIEQIHQLKARYFRAVDGKDWALLESVLTPDAVLEVAGNRREGRDEIIGVMRTRLSPKRTVHHGHMPEITLTGPGTASGIWAMYDLLVDPDGTRREGYGHYYEQYLLLDGVWRIQHLRLVRIELDGG